MAPDTGWATTATDGRWTVSVHGELDVETGPRLRDYVGAELERCTAPELALDLRAVSFCDSSGLQALTFSLRRARSLGRRLPLVLPRESRTHRLLELAGVLEVFDIEHPASYDGPAQASKSSRTAGVTGRD